MGKVVFVVNVTVHRQMVKCIFVGVVVAAIPRASGENLRPRGILPAGLPECVVTRLPQLVVNGQEIVRP